MPFQISLRAAGDVALAQLTDQVNKQLAQAGDAEDELIRLCGDTATKMIESADRDQAVDINIGGSFGDNSKAISFSVTVTALRPRGKAGAGKQVAPWSPPGGGPEATDRPGSAGSLSDGDTAGGRSTT